jgi:hypothetical protein
MNNTTPDPEALARVKKILGIALGIPAVIAFIFTQMQWYPATYAIDWLTDEKGEFSFKLAFAINFMFLAIPAGIITFIIVAATNKKKGA